MFLLRGFLDFLTVIFRRAKFLMMAVIMIASAALLLGIYNERIVQNIPVYVVDHDNSTVSRTVRRFLAANPSLRVLGTLDSPEEAEAAFNRDDAAAVVYIPDGLSAAVKTQKGGHVFAFIDGSNMLAARNADAAITTVVKTVSVGVAMVALQKQGMPDFELMGALQPINLDVDRPFNTLGSYSDYLLPVFMFFLVALFTTIMTAAAFQEPIPEEVEKRRYRRRYYYIGRLLAILPLAFIGGVFVFLHGLPRVDIVLRSAPIMAFSTLLIFIALTELFYTIINIICPRLLAMSLSYLIGMLSVMFSGLTWPLEMMPWYIHEFATWIPLTPFLQAVQVFLYHDANWNELSEFGMMFFKQAILLTALLFIIMRFKDILIFAKWLAAKLTHKPLAAVGTGEAALLNPDVLSSNKSDIQRSIAAERTLTPVSEARKIAAEPEPKTEMQVNENMEHEENLENSSLNSVKMADSVSPAKNAESDVLGESASTSASSDSSERASVKTVSESSRNGETAKTGDSRLSEEG